jgi:hypothetical protein
MPSFDRIEFESSVYGMESARIPRVWMRFSIDQPSIVGLTRINDLTGAFLKTAEAEAHMTGPLTTIQSA